MKPKGQIKPALPEWEDESIAAAVEAFVDTLPSLSTSRSYRAAIDSLAAFCDVMKIRSLADLTATQALAYADTVLAKTSVATARARTSANRALFRYLAGKELVADNPFDQMASLPNGVTTSSSIPGYTADDITRLLDMTTGDPLAKRDRALISLLFATMTRPGQIASMKCGDIVRRGDMVQLAHSQTRIREPYGSEVAAYLEERGGQDHEPLFPSGRAAGAIQGSTVYQAVRARLRKADLDPKGGAQAIVRAGARTIIESAGGPRNAGGTRSLQRYAEMPADGR